MNNYVGNKQKVSIWNASFISIFVVNFALNMGQYMMNTLIPKYANYLGATASIVGVVSSMFAITALVIRPVAGPAFDYYSKKKLLMLAIGVIAVAFAGYSLSNSVTMIMIFRLLHGFGMGCTAPLALAIAGDSLPEEKMASGLGIFSLAQAISSAVGPSIGLALSTNIGYNKTFALGAGAVAFACVLTAVIREPKHEEHKEPFRIQADRIIAKDAILPAVIMAFLSMAYACINSFIAIYGEARGVEQIGLFFTVYAVGLLMSRPLSGTIADRYGLDKVVVPACILFSLAFFIMSIADSLWIFLIAGGISAFGYGACQPAMQALCMKCVPKERRGAGANTNYFGVDIGQLSGPVIAGKIVESIQNSTGVITEGYAVMYRCMIIPISIAMVIFLLKKKKLMAK